MEVQKKLQLSWDVMLFRHIYINIPTFRRHYGPS